MDKSKLLELLKMKQLERKAQLAEEVVSSRKCAQAAHEAHSRGLVENPWLIYSREYGSIVATERKALQKFAEVFQLNVQLGKVS